MPSTLTPKKRTQAPIGSNVDGSGSMRDKRTTMASCSAASRALRTLSCEDCHGLARDICYRFAGLKGDCPAVLVRRLIQLIGVQRADIIKSARATVGSDLVIRLDAKLQGSREMDRTHRKTLSSCHVDITTLRFTTVSVKGGVSPRYQLWLQHSTPSSPTRAIVPPR